MRVRILGPVEVEVEGRPCPIAKPKERAVLAVLALHPKRLVSAETLIDALWGDDPPATATKTLQAHVSKLRGQMGGEHIRTEGGGYLLEVDGGYVDATRFETLLRTASESMSAGQFDEALRSLDDALSSWRGEPFPELAPGPLVDGERSRLVELHLEATTRRADVLLSLDRASDVIAELEALVQHHPLREPLWARLMMALYRSGRQSDALRAYQRARSGLIEQLGIEPGTELRSLEQRIIEQDPELLATTVTVATESARPTPIAAGDAGVPTIGSDLRWATRGRQFPFAARGAEADLLENAWRDAKESGLAVAFVSGEAGVGKTRLVAELARSVGGHALVLFGRCDEDLAAPYQPFIEGLRALVAACPSDVLPGLLGPLAPELRRLLPELGERVPDLGEPMTTDDGTARLRLFDAVRELLLAVARTAPTVLVLDDLHWATADTVQLLRHVTREAEPVPLLIVGTFRDTDVADDEPLPKLVADLWRAGQRHRVELASFPSDGVRALLAAANGHDLPAEADPFVAALVDETGGNVMFLTEVVAHLVETGALEQQSERWVATTPTDGIELPPGLRDVVLRRVDRLPAETVPLLQTAAIIGPSFDTDVLATVAGVDEDGVDDALEPANRAGIIAPDPSSFGRYRFTHALLRGALDERTRGPRRTRMQWRIGEALLSGRHAGNRETLDRAALHLCAGAAAGEPERAARIALDAGAAALADLDSGAAHRHYHAAIAVLSDRTDVPALAFDAWQGIATAEILAGDDHQDAAVEAGNHGLDAAIDLRDPDRVMSIVMTLARLGNYFTSPPSGVVDLDERALEWLGPEPSAPRGVVAAALTQALWNSWEAFYSRRADRYDEAMTIGLDLPSGEERSFILKHWDLVGPTQLALAARAREAYLDESERSDDPVIEAQTLQAELSTHRRLHLSLDRTTSEVIGLADRLEQLAVQIRDPELAGRSSYLSVGLLIDRGDLAGAEARMRDRTVAPTDRLAGNLWRAWSTQLIGDVLYHQGRMAEIADSSTRLRLRARHDLERIQWAGGNSIALVAAGRPDEAIGVLDDVLERQRNVDAKLFELAYVSTWLSEAAAAVGHEAALVWCRGVLARDPGRAVGAGASHGTTDLFLGVIDAALGNHESADSNFAAAEAHCLGLELPLWVNQTRCFWAESLADRDPARAAELARAALAGAEPLGQKVVTDRARSLLDR